jgi:alginate O-acetyltransferase complex protein AlgI
MLFNSWEFLILLATTFALYHVPIPGMKRRTWQVVLLLAASAVFYAWNEPRLLILLAASCILNAFAVERILAAKAESGNLKSGKADKARRWLAGTVALNLGFLAFFKYAGFLVNLFPDTLIPASSKSWLSGIPLPVGISFYTFQGISLVVDVWRNDISHHTSERLALRGSKRAGSVLDTSFYISFFPQLVAGPIVKAHEFVDQIGAKCFAEIDWITVRRSLVTGYLLKIFIADNLAEQTGLLTLGAESMADMRTLSSMSLLYSYSLQIFADFAGYSLIAIGLGALFGYKLPQNFNFPYLSTSITEFWRRWHLSLSSWLRDYLYFPLGGNRKGAGRTYFNLFLVMFLGGLWHGAAWKFALWGSLHGLFLALERLASKSTKNQELRTKNKTTSILKWFVTFHLVTALWLTFMMPDMESILAFFKSVLAMKLKVSGPPLFSLAFYGSMVVLYHAWGWLREHRPEWSHKLARSPMEAVLHGAMVFLVLTNPGAPQGFIYFQF